MRAKLVSLFVLLAAVMALSSAVGAMAQQQAAPSAGQAEAQAYCTAPNMTDQVKQAIEKSLVTSQEGEAMRLLVLSSPAEAQKLLGEMKVKPEDAEKAAKLFQEDPKAVDGLIVALGGKPEESAELKAVLGTNPGAAQALVKKIKADIAMGQKLRDCVKPGEEPGYLGIPGAPVVHWIWGLLWAIWVGWIFSTVGAFGGIMAGVGHITIFGFGEYASKFGEKAPVNALVTDSIRVSNQWLAALSALIGSFKYYRMGRLVAPLGFCMAIGAVGGSWLVPAASAGRINLKDYVGYFGLCVLLLGVLLLRDLTAKGQARQKKAKEAANAFEKKVAEGGDTTEQGVKIVEGSWSLMSLALLVVLASALIYKFMGPAKGVAPWTDVWFWACTAMAVVGGLFTVFIGKIRFTFFGVEFGFKAWLPMLGGLVIAALSSFLGVGGGFLYVPFLTSIAGLPMFLVAGTSSLVVLVGMIISIFSYMFGKGVVVEWSLIGAELVGIFIGSLVGPATSKFIPDKVLRLIFIVLAFLVGLGYTLNGLFGVNLPLS